MNSIVIMYRNRPIGVRLIISAKILFANFSLLSRETMLKGRSNKEAIEEKNIAPPNIACAPSCEVLNAKKSETGKTMTVNRAI